MEIELTALEGTNPIAVLGALGVLDALDRAGRGPRLRWTADLVPHAVVDGADDLDDLVAVLLADRHHVVHSCILDAEQAGGTPFDDLKPESDALAAWADRIGATGDLVVARRFGSLLAEGAVAGKGDAKPTHLHFTAGQQRFLSMLRELRAALTADDLRSALIGPWHYTTGLPSLSWDNRGERIYALRGSDPSKEKRPSAPAVEWLAWTGLTFVPVAVRGRTLVTAGCDAGWKSSAWRWPLWGSSLSAVVVRSLLADPGVVGEHQRRGPRWEAALRARGITAVLQAPIRRTDQGGYGSFGPGSFLADLM